MEKTKKSNKAANIVYAALPAIILIVLIIAIWEGVCVANNIPTWQLPKPSDIGSALVAGAKDTAPYLLSTYVDILVGFVLAVVIGIAFALLISNVPVLADALTPLVMILCCVPMVTLVPLLLVSMGTGPGPKILTIIIQCFPIVNMNACVGFANADPSRVELMQSMKATKFELYRYCIFPDALPTIFTGIKLSSVLAMISGVAAELCGGEGGLGNHISYLLGVNRTPEALANLLYVMILGLVLYGVITLLEKKLVKR